MSYIQKTAWGQVEWLTEHVARSSQGMSVGIATILPHVRQEPHIHYESEQFVYILQGHGIDIVDGEERPFSKDMFYCFKPNITHELVNLGDVPVRHLLVSVSTATRPIPEFDEEDCINLQKSFYGAVEAIRGQIMKVSIPVTIFDDHGNLVIQNRKHPQYCLKHCGPADSPRIFPCMARRLTDGGGSSVGFKCPHGLSVFCNPIQYKGQTMGKIYSGHILLGGGAAEQKTGMYDTPAGTMLAIQKWMANTAQSIISYCRFDAMRQKMSEKDSLIEQNLQNQRILEENLQTMRDTVTNLRINHHFLFNTLNAIASQVLEGDRFTTYQTVVDLAKMFRYTTNNNYQMVPLSSELEYLNTYLHMQKLRYGSELQVDMDCDEEAICALVPFNFLQPIIENAFTHGFTDYAGQKKLEIRIKANGEKIDFHIRNNGLTIDDTTLKRVMTGIQSDSGHGMALVFSKLKATYQDRFQLKMYSSEVQGTRIFIEIPFQKDIMGGQFL